ncbi:MAG: 3-hydroxyacyl-CoA dehydrogenase family protein [Desulfomonilaceae bacterium]
MTITKVGVVGCGTMGSGIAQVCAQSGYEVIVCEGSDELLVRGLKSIEEFLNKGVERGKVSVAQKDLVLGRIIGTTNLNGFSDCDLVVEATREDADEKKEVLGKLDKICPSHTILTSNTSSLSIIDLASATNRADKFAGLHFMNPAPLMKLVEIVTSIATSETTIDACTQFAESLDKTVIVAKDIPGFIVNYLQYPSSCFLSCDLCPFTPNTFPVNIELCHFRGLVISARADRNASR